MKLKIIDCEFSVCKVADYSGVDMSTPYVFAGSTEEEHSLVCPFSRVPANVTARNDGWRGFRIEGVLDFSLVGILSRISSLLAENGIGLFAVSTFKRLGSTTSMTSTPCVFAQASSMAPSQSEW